MSQQFNAKCKICGTPYYVCGDCSKTKTFTPWRTIVCSINCYKIYSTLSMYTNKHSTKEEVKSNLEQCDLSALDSFVDNIKTSIKDIMSQKNKRKNTSKKTTKFDTDSLVESNNDGVSDGNIE